MAATTIVLISIGRIFTMLPSHLVLDSASPDDLPKSAVVLAEPTPANSQHFYLGFTSGDSILDGPSFIATYDLQYILEVSNGKVVYTPVPPDVFLVNGAPWPNDFLTPDKLYYIVRLCNNGAVRFEPKSADGSALDVHYSDDSVGQSIIVFPFHAGVNQCFGTENPIRAG